MIAPLNGTPPDSCQETAPSSVPNEQWADFVSILPENRSKLTSYYIVEEVYNRLFKNYLFTVGSKDIEHGVDLPESRPTASTLYGSPIRELGKGSFGNVFLWEKTDPNNPQTKHHYAVKSIRINSQRKSLKYECTRVFRELVISYSLNDKSIVKAYDLLTAPSHDEFLLVQEYVEGITLKEAIKSINLFYLPKFYDRIFKQIVLLVKHLHDFDIGHNDLKAGNIIINPNDHSIKIVDFGLSRFLSEFFDAEAEKMLLRSGTSRYLPPESHFSSLNGYRNDINIKRLIKSKDIWSLGLIYYNMISKGDHLWEVSHPSDSQFNEYKQQSFIPRFHSMVEFSNKITRVPQDDAIDLSKKIMFYGMIHLQNHKRVPIEYILESHWFRNIPDTLQITDRDIELSDKLADEFNNQDLSTLFQKSS